MDWYWVALLAIVIFVALAALIVAVVAAVMRRRAERDPHAYSLGQRVILLLAGSRKPPEKRMTVVLNSRIEERITRRQVRGHDFIEAISVLENFDEGDTLIDAESMRYLHLPNRCAVLGVVD